MRRERPERKDRGGDLAQKKIGSVQQLVAGDRDEVIDLAFLREPAERHAPVRMEVWPGGHELPLRDPERCAAALRSLAEGDQNQPRSPTATRS